MDKKLWSVGLKDWLHGLVVAVLTAVLTLVVQALQAGSQIDWKGVGLAALIAGASYVLKKFGSDEQGKLGGKL